MHVVPVLVRVEQVEVVGLQKLVGQQRAAEREPLAANSVLTNASRILVWEVYRAVFGGSYGRYQANPRPYKFFKRANC